MSTQTRNIVTELPDGRFLLKGVVLSYPYLASPQESDDDRPPKYSVAGVIDSSTQDFTVLTKAVVEAAKETFGKDAAKKLRPGGPLRNPLRDGEYKYGEGMVFFNARSNRQPGLATNIPDPKTGKPMLVPDDQITDVFYPGAIVNMILSLYTYNRSDNKGVGLGIEGVQKVADGERLDSRVDVSNVFEADPDAIVTIGEDELDAEEDENEDIPAAEEDEDELAGLLG